MVVSRLLTCLDTLGGVGGPLRLEAVGVLRVTSILLVGALVPVENKTHRSIDAIAKIKMCLRSSSRHLENMENVACRKLLLRFKMISR